MLQVENVGAYNSAAVAAHIVRVAGDIDFSSAELFRDCLERASSDRDDTLIVSLEGCKYLDSSGLAVLVDLHKTIGSRLKLIVSQGTCVYRILSITGLHRALNVFSSVSEAVVSSQSTPPRVAR